MRLRTTAARLAPEGIPGLKARVRASIDESFGGLPFDPSRDPGDRGLHGPGSATWRVLGEPAAILGGVRGVMVQLLHPLAMAGVADHSAYARDAAGRLQRTSAYVTTTAFGSLDEALERIATVRRRHDPVRGQAPDGRPYRADDPRLLAWVSVALTESFLATDAAYAPEPVTGEAADRFVLEQSRLAGLLDPRVELDRLARDPAARERLRAGTEPLPMLEEGLLPASVAELEDVIAGFEPELGLNEQGRDAIAFIESPPTLESDAEARVHGVVVSAALSTIPWARREVCGWPTGRRWDRRARLGGHALCGVMRVGGGRQRAVLAAEQRAHGRPVPAVASEPDRPRAGQG